MKRHIGIYIFLLGSLFTLGFAPIFLWPISILAIGGLYVLATKASSTKQALGVGFVFGLGHFITSLYWLPRSFYIDNGGNFLPAMLAGIPALLGISIVMALLLGTVTALTYKAKNLQPFAFLILFIGLEIAKNFPPILFPWNPLGAIFANSPALMQGAYLGTVTLLSAIAVATGILVINGITTKKYAQILAGIFLIFSLYIYGINRLNNAPKIEEQATLTTVRLVQGNVPTIQKWQGSQREKILYKYLNQTPTNNPSVTTIIWPETAIAYAVKRDFNLRQFISKHLQPTQNLLLGFLHFEANKTMFNSLGTINSNGELTQIYDKNLLVPFGESLPFAKFTQKFLRTLSFNRAVYQAGQTPAKINLGQGIIAMPLICYEGAFPFYVHKNLSNQNVLLNITNDSWFDNTTAPQQHFAMARLRAVETGLPLIRLANTGRSAVIDAYGRIVKQLPLKTTTAIDIAVPIGIRK